MMSIGHGVRKDEISESHALQSSLSYMHRAALQNFWHTLLDQRVAELVIESMRWEKHEMQEAQVCGRVEQ